MFLSSGANEGAFSRNRKTPTNKNKKNPNDFLWHRFWFLIRKGDRVVAGSADFKGVPNTDQEVEIGYGLGKEFEHNGSMTEAVQAMCKWALE